MPIISLHYATQPIIENPVDEVLYLIRHFIFNPGFTSTLFSDQELSFRGLITRYPKDPQAVADAVVNHLQAAFTRVLPDYGLRVSVNFEFQDTNNYKLSLAVLDSAGNPFIPAGIIEIVDNQFTFKYVGVK